MKTPECDANDVVLVSLMLALNIYQTFFCFYIVHLEQLDICKEVFLLA